MPPSNPPPFNPTDHLLPRPSEASREGGPPAQKSSVGPVVGIIIIVALLIIGAFYFWGAFLNAQNPEDVLPLIPGDDSAPVR